MTLPQDIIGVDIAKCWIDTYTLSTRKHERILVPKKALARFARAAKGTLVVVEASGGYERPLTEALRHAQVDCARVNPGRRGSMRVRRAGWPRPTASMPRCWPEWAGRWNLRPPRPPTPTAPGWPTSWPAATISWR